MLEALLTGLEDQRWFVIDDLIESASIEATGESMDERGEKTYFSAHPLASAGDGSHPDGRTRRQSTARN